MKSTRKLNEEEFKDYFWEEQEIILKIPKFTNVLIVTTISEAKNGGTNVSTITYGNKEIEEFIKGEKKQN